ncbi:Glycosyltransferase involved in cell wall bisynthesis [Candidatus Methanophagaceae archaeon]|nr:Glycosyltransferase involved in cell wall bisynthesis [Methanophagales archaeon]
MKVIQLADGFYPLVGGGSIAIRTWIENMPDVEFEVITNALPSQNLLERYPYSKNCYIRRFLPVDITYSPSYNGRKKLPLVPYKILSEWLRFSRKINYLKRAEYEILHFNGPVTNYGFFMFDRILHRSCLTNLNDFSSINRPKVLTLHGLPSEFTDNRADKENEERIIKMFDNIICVESHIATKVKEYSKKIRQDKKVWFIPNSVDITLFSFAPLPNEDKLKVGFIGRLAENHGLDLLTKLIDNLPSYVEIHIAALGKTDFINEFKSRFAKTGRIHFYPNVPYVNLPRIFHGIDILFNPVKVPGLSRASLESMSCGRPVIMIKTGDRYPTVQNKTGFLINDDIYELLELLECLNNNRTILTRLGKNAREIAEKEFSHNVLIPKLKRIYESLTK